MLAGTEELTAAIQQKLDKERAAAILGQLPEASQVIENIVQEERSKARDSQERMRELLQDLNSASASNENALTSGERQKLGELRANFNSLPELD